MNKSLLIRSIAIGFIAGTALYASLVPQTINADAKNLNASANSSTLVHNGHLTICKLDRSDFEVVRTVKMVVTAYSSTVDQTDDRPRETASGDEVEDGVIAINGLPFGTLVRIPEISGDKIYTVKDRMHSRKGTRHADIWFESYEVAKNFGAKYNVSVQILES